MADPGFSVGGAWTPDVGPLWQKCQRIGSCKGGRAPSTPSPRSANVLIDLFQNAGADPGFDQGGPQIVTGLNCRQCAAASRE